MRARITLVRRLRLDGETGETDETNDAGFGIIEIVVAMFLLGLLAVAVMPLLVQGLTLSSTNATLAAATQLANQQIEQVRTQQSCALVTPATVSTTANGHTLNATRTVGPCPASGYPLTVPVSVSVTRADGGAVLATASTLVFVTTP